MSYQNFEDEKTIDMSDIKIEERSNKYSLIMIMATKNFNETDITLHELLHIPINPRQRPFFSIKKCEFILEKDRDIAITAISACSNLFSLHDSVIILTERGKIPFKFLNGVLN